PSDRQPPRPVTAVCSSSRRVCSAACSARKLWILIVATLLSFGPLDRAQAQRSNEDAVAEAIDAFGLSVGREAIGLYSATSARGFSPVQAGNLRIDGLYFDQVSANAVLPVRIVRSAAVHVGIAAQGYLFPAHFE